MPVDPDRKEYLVMNEYDLCKVVEKSVSMDFDLIPQVPGKHLITKHKEVRIDFLMHPKQHLLHRRFEDIWIGCEVKSPARKLDPIRYISDSMKQIIDYTQCEFEGGIRPAYVLLFPSMYHFLHAKNLMTPDRKGFLYFFRSFIQRFNVGTLHIFAPGDWDIRFGSQRYYSTQKGRGNVPNLGTKKHIGYRA